MKNQNSPPEQQGMHQNAAPKIFDNARKLRNRLTKAEVLLWEKISGRQLGHKFRRQHAIGFYVADFYCHQLKLIIELDGGYHLLNEQIEYDKLRTENLESVGLKVIRFSNEEVYEQMDGVIEKIKKVIEGIENSRKEIL